MRSWQIHLLAGLRVRGAPAPAVDADFSSGIGLGPLRLWAPCRVVWLEDTPTRYGYGFGTLPGHPEIGEEAFEVTLEPSGAVRFRVRAFSKHASWYAKLGAPVTVALQAHVTTRYAASAVKLANSR